MCAILADCDDLKDDIVALDGNPAIHLVNVFSRCGVSITNIKKALLIAPVVLFNTKVNHLYHLYYQHQHL